MSIKVAEAILTLRKRHVYAKLEVINFDAEWWMAKLCDDTDSGEMLRGNSGKGLSAQSDSFSEAIEALGELVSKEIK